MLLKKKPGKDAKKERRSEKLVKGSRWVDRSSLDDGMSRGGVMRIPKTVVSKFNGK